jgi:hypothetical protein
VTPAVLLFFVLARAWAYEGNNIAVLKTLIFVISH